MIWSMRAPRKVPDSVAAMLQSGETSLAYELAQADDAGHDASAPLDPGVFRAGDLLDPFTGPVEVNVDYLAARMAAAEPDDTQHATGQRFRLALGVPGAERLLLTTQRLAVIGGDLDRLFAPDKKDMIYFSVERCAVRSIRRAARTFQRGRVRLEFADGSWATAMMGMLCTGPADRLVEAHQNDD